MRTARPPATRHNERKEKPITATVNHQLGPNCQASPGIGQHPTRPTELQPSLQVQGGSLRSPRAARPPAGPALLSPPRSSPAGARAARRAISRLRSEKGYVAAGAVGSTALGSHFGASLEDHGPNVVLYRAGPQTARRAGSLRGRDHSRQSSSSPKPLRRPHVEGCWLAVSVRIGCDELPVTLCRPFQAGVSVRWPFRVPRGSASPDRSPDTRTTTPSPATPLRPHGRSKDSAQGARPPRSATERSWQPSPCVVPHPDGHSRPGRYAPLPRRKPPRLQSSRPATRWAAWSAGGT